MDAKLFPKSIPARQGDCFWYPVTIIQAPSCVDNVSLLVVKQEMHHIAIYQQIRIESIHSPSRIRRRTGVGEYKARRGPSSPFISGK